MTVLRPKSVDEAYKRAKAAQYDALKSAKTSAKIIALDKMNEDVDDANRAFKTVDNIRSAYGEKRP